MPNTVPAAGEAMPSTEPYTVDDAHIDTMDLARQMQATYDIVHEMDFGKPGVNRNTELDLLASVMRVTLQKAKQVAADVDRMERACVTEVSATRVVDFRAKAFRHICDMETPLTTIGDLLRMINVMCIADGVFTDQEDASALQRTGWLAMEELKKVEKLRGNLFYLTHTDASLSAEREGM